MNDKSNTDKYEINKSRYQKLYQSGGMPEKRFIILDGTSSSGKTTVCKYFSKQGYKCIMSDDYGRNAFQLFQSEVKNEYMTDIERKEKINKILGDLMIADAISSGENVIIDDIYQAYLIKSLEEKKMNDEIYVIIVYTPIQDLARNMESRRKELDPRGIFVFKQYAEKYTKTNPSDPRKIDSVNRKKFKQILLNNFKYSFGNEDELTKFAVDTFAIMNIHDDNDHWIKLKDEYRADYLLNTSGKSKDDIFKELVDLA